MKPLLRQADVWIWTFEKPSAPPDFWALLSPDEVTRANRFFKDTHRDAFVHAHGLLRQTLADYLECSPSELEFEVGEHGKPFLVQAPDLHFNLSHTQGAVALALTRAGAIGVDIETRDRGTDVDQVAKRYFRDDEWLPAATELDVRRLRFFDLWSLKEAYMKARGLGMALSLTSFGFPASDEHEFLPRLDAEGVQSLWTFGRTRLEPSYHLAACVESPEVEFVFKSIPGRLELL